MIVPHISTRILPGLNEVQQSFVDGLSLNPGPDLWIFIHLPSIDRGAISPLPAYQAVRPSTWKFKNRSETLKESQCISFGGFALHLTLPHCQSIRPCIHRTGISKTSKTPSHSCSVPPSCHLLTMQIRLCVHWPAEKILSQTSSLSGNVVKKEQSLTMSLPVNMSNGLQVGACLRCCPVPSYGFYDFKSFMARCFFAYTQKGRWAVMII